MKQILALCVVLLLTVRYSIAQGLAINTDGTAAHASAMLDIKNPNKGLLIPRVALVSDSDVLTIATPRISLLIYNTTAALPDGEGFYFWNGSKWSKLVTRTNLANLAWNTSGNAGTNANTDFIGTTDTRPLVFKTNNILSGKIELGTSNVFFGRSAGLSNSTGINNSYFGDNAGAATTTGSGNLFMGHNAGNSNLTGNNNVFVGQGSGKNSSAGNDNVFVGEDAGFNLTGVHETVAIGSGALFSSPGSSASHNIAIGFQSLFSNTIGNSNTAIGYQSLSSNTTGSLNTAVGRHALNSNTTGQSNTAVGYHAMEENTTGYFNTATGLQALLYNTSGFSNTAVGYSAMLYNTTGSQNAAYGYLSLPNNTNGDFNTAIGVTALRENTTGNSNTGVGYGALRDNVSGQNNSGLGLFALSNNQTGDNNTAVGHSAGTDISGSNLNNTTALGYDARMSTNNTMVFGNGSVDRWAFGLTTTTAQHALEVGANATNGNGAFLTQGGVWTNTSDINKKEDFSSLDGNDLLQKISDLSIQRWKYKGTNEYHIGPTAQDFYKAFNVGTDDKSISTVDPAGISLLAIQELIKDNKRLRAELDEIRDLLKKATGQ